MKMNMVRHKHTILSMKREVQKLFLNEFWFILIMILFIGFFVLEGFDLDRKSTRLNSSHVSISYAVFCLKKKNTKTDLIYFNRYDCNTVRHRLYRPHRLHT